MFGRQVSDAHSHVLLVLFAAGQFALLVQEVDEAHQQQEQQNTHHHSYHHSAGASLLLIGCSAGHTWKERWWGLGVSGDRSGCKVWAVKRSRRQDREEWPRLGNWEWTSGQVDEQVGGEEKEQGVGYEVSLIFGMQWLKKWTQKKKPNKWGLNTNRCFQMSDRSQKTTQYILTLHLHVYYWTFEDLNQWHCAELIKFQYHCFFIGSNGLTTPISDAADSSWKTQACVVASSAMLQWTHNFSFSQSGLQRRCLLTLIAIANASPGLMQ